jgi:hypothetical protein
MDTDTEVDKGPLALQLGGLLHTLDDDAQLKCLKLFMLVTSCFVDGRDTAGVLLLRVNNTLTVAGLNTEELDAQELVIAAATAFVDLTEVCSPGVRH